MNILAFDSCFAACSAAAAKAFAGVKGAPDRIHARFEQMQTGHAERLVTMISEVMADAGLSFADLERIAVTNGPGSFTGTRISVSAARALALAGSRDLIAVSSLAVMAEGAAAILSDELLRLREAGIGSIRLAIAVDARRGEVYVQHFRSGGVDPLTEPLLMPVAAAAALGGEEPLIVAGSGAASVAAAARDQGRSATAYLPDLLPDARHLLALAAGMAPERGAVRPLYLRPADARPQVGHTIERART